MNHEGHKSVPPSALSHFLPKTVHGWMMFACCSLMIVAAAPFIFGIGDNISPSDSMLALLPIAGCLVMHLFMHRMMGSHSSHEQPAATKAAKSAGPSIKNALQKD